MAHESSEETGAGPGGARRVGASERGDAEPAPAVFPKRAPKQRAVTLERVDFAHFRATNRAGVTLEVGERGAFTPVELLLTAIAACSAMDVDYIVSKRDQPTAFRLRSHGTQIRDEDGNHLVGVDVTFDAEFADTEEGAEARAALTRAIQMSHDRLCTVTRTVILGTDVEFRQGEVGDLDPGPVPDPTQ